MKNFILFIGLFIFISCSQSKEEQLISDYEQTIGNTKTNLNFKLKKIEFIKDVKVKDSLLFYNNVLDKFKNQWILHHKKDIKDNEKEIEILKSLIDEYKRTINDKKFLNVVVKPSLDEIKNLNDKITFDKEIIKSLDDMDPKEIGYVKDVQKGTIEKINQYEKGNKDSVLCKEYDVTYTINNPMLNNVEQTISKKYYFNSDISRILKVSE